MNWSRGIIVAVFVSAFLGCTDVVTDGVVGKIHLGIDAADNENTKLDVAAVLEGVWMFSDLEDEAVILAKHVGPGSLRVAWPTWNGSGFDLESTVAVTSVIPGSGLHLLNVNPVYDAGRDSSIFWTFLYRTDQDLMVLYQIDADYIEGLRHGGRIRAALDTIDNRERLLLSSQDLEDVIVEAGWELWDEDQLMVLRRLHDADKAFR
jgi:hypothetical protein